MNSSTAKLSVVPLQPPDPSVIELCRNLLQAAERGEVQGFIYVAERIHSEIEIGGSCLRNRFMAIALLERAKFRLLHQIDQDDHDDEAG